MLIALDYDETYTMDPALWDMFITNAQERGHTVMIATMRFEHEIEDIRSTMPDSLDIMCTGRQAKQKYLSDHDIYPDIWIDDSPYWLLNDAAGAAR